MGRESKGKRMGRRFRCARFLVEAVEPRVLLFGTPDATFSVDGRVTSDAGGSESVAAVLVQQDAKVVAVGTSGPAAASDFFLARYNVDGTVDSNFAGGQVKVDLG